MWTHVNPEIIPFFFFSQSVGSGLTSEPGYYMDFISGNPETEDNWRQSQLSWWQNHLNSRLTQRISYSLATVEANVERPNPHSSFSHLPAQTPPKGKSQTLWSKLMTLLKIIISPNCWPKKWGLWCSVWFSQCNSWISSITITWELIRNASSQAFPWIYWVRNSRDGVQQAVF